MRKSSSMRDVMLRALLFFTILTVLIAVHNKPINPSLKDVSNFTESYLTPLLLIPDVGDTILLSHKTGRPLFLSPLTLRTATKLLEDLSTKHMLQCSEKWEDSGLRHAKCFGHRGHCIPMVEDAGGGDGDKGIRGLLRVLKSMGYKLSFNLWIVAYDWRKGLLEVVEDDGWKQKVDTVFRNGLRERIVVVGIGYGCGIVREWLRRQGQQWVKNNVEQFWCLGGSDGASVGSIATVIDGWGFLESGWGREIDVLSPLGRFGDATTADFASMEFEMGLKRKRRKLLPDIDEAHQWLRALPKRRNYTGLNEEVIVRQSVTMPFSGGLRESRHLQELRRLKMRVAKTFQSHWDMIYVEAASHESPRILMEVEGFGGVHKYTVSNLSSFWKRHASHARIPVSKSHDRLTSGNLGVEVNCVYGSGVETVSDLRYRTYRSSSKNSLELEEVGLVDGDGVVTKNAALEYCTSFGSTVNIFEAPFTQHFDRVGLSMALRADLESKPPG